MSETLLRLAIAVAVTAGSMVVVAAVARRVLGVHIGLVRSALAAAAALVAELGFESQVVWNEATNRVAFIPLQIGITIFIALLFLVAAEMIVPRGGVPRPHEIVRSVRVRTQQSQRGSALTAIALRNGLPSLARLRTNPFTAPPDRRAEQAQALRRALEQAGVTFVKLGQMLSTRRDLLPAEYTEALSQLQENVDPQPWDELAQTLARELGNDPGNIFAHIDPEPLAAASIGQVHRARLHTGEEVVIKIQRSGIRPIIERDLGIAVSVAGRLEASASWARSLGLETMVQGFASALREELDYRIEARNMAALRSVVAAQQYRPEITVPAPYLVYSTERVLVMEFLTGKTLGSIGAASEYTTVTTAQPAVVARTLFDSLLRQVIVDGVFHADPHPGNIMLLDDGRIALLDCGSIGRIDAELRSALEQFMVAIERGDPRQVSDALFGFVARPEFIDEDGLRRSMGRFMAQHLGPGAEPGLAMFTDLIRVLSQHQLAVPAEIATAFRAVGALEGTLTAIAPDFDIIEQTQSFARDQFAARLRPKSLGDTASSELLTLLPLVRRAPRHLDRIASSLDQGRLKIKIGMFSDERERDLITGLVNQTLLALLAIGCGIMAALLLTNPGGPPVTSTLTLYEVFGYDLLILSAILNLRVLFVIFAGRRRSRFDP